MQQLNISGLRRKRFFRVLGLSVVAICCFLLISINLKTPSLSAKEPLALKEKETSQGVQLHALFDAEWEWKMKEEPVAASYFGDARYANRWPDISLKAIEHRHKHRQDVLKRFETV